MLQEHRTVSVVPQIFVNHEGLQQHDEPALSRADREKEMHRADCDVAAPAHKNAATIRLLKNQAESAELRALVAPEIAILAEKLAKKIRQLTQVGRSRGFNGRL